jgi:hypothetical protein
MLRGSVRTGARRELFGPVHWLGGALALVAALLLSVRDPHEGGSFGTCPVLALTGLYCPGCGSLRATYDLLHGNVVEAVGHNAVLVLLLPVAFGLWVRRLAGGSPPEPGRAWLWTRLVLVGLVLWTVLRNVSLHPFSVLAP